MDANLTTKIQNYLKNFYVRKEVNLPRDLKDFVYKYKKGICFIFDHFEYKDGEHSTRHGTEYDRAGLIEVFGAMNFEVKPYVDRTKAQIFSILETFARNEDDYDCLVVFILTHGDKSSLCANDEMYSLESIFNIVLGNSSPKLAGRPKIFIVNACNGTKIDNGATALVEEEDSIGDDIMSYTLPTTADFLVAFSSVSDYVSYRERYLGTWFIQCLITVLNENLVNETKLDFESLLTILKDRIAVNNEFEDHNGEKHKQMPVTVSTLRKKIFIPNV